MQAPSSWTEQGRVGAVDHSNAVELYAGRHHGLPDELVQAAFGLGMDFVRFAMESWRPIWDGDRPVRASGK